MKALIALIPLALTVMVGCGSSNNGSSTTAATPVSAFGSACTISNGAYYYNGQGPYATCPVQSTGVGSSACTISNGGYYYNGQGPYQTCPVNTGVGGIGGTVGTHNCANQTMMDGNGMIGQCTAQYNYCASFQMYTLNGQPVYCQ